VPAAYGYEDAGFGCDARGRDPWGTAGAQPSSGGLTVASGMESVERVRGI
jgi:hypothetical protein